MKKYAMIFAALSAAVMISSCAKEQIAQPADEPADEPITETGLVPMTFIASAEDAASKAVLNADGKTVEWEGTESISVFDNINTTNHKFDAKTSGSTTSFNGEVNDGATSFVAVYPYDAGIVYDSEASNPISYEIPRIQEATLGSFDPKAAVFVSTSDDISKKFTFKAAFALLKVNVDIDDIVAVQVAAAGKKMSGSVKFGTGGGNGDGTGDRYQYVVLKKSDDSVLAKGDYYIVVRHLGSLSDTNVYTDLTVTYIKSDASALSRTKSGDINSGVVGRKSIVNLGKLSNFPGSPSVSRYIYYQAFLDTTIGGETYNRADDGDATLLADATVFKTGMTGLNFVEASASISNTSEVTITGDVVLASNNPAQPATYTVSAKSFLFKSGSLVMDNMIVNMAALSGSGQFFTKKDNDGNFSSLTLWQCDFRSIARPVYAPNSSYLLNGVESVLINGCRFGVGADVQLFAINSKATTLAGYKDFTFTNNVLYSTTGNALQTYVFSTSASGIVESTCNQEVVMDNNLFYNVAASNGIFRTHYLKSIYIRNNILFAKDGTYDNNIKVFKANLATASASSVFAGASSNNYCYGSLGGKSWTISDSACRGPLTNVKDVTTTPGVNPVSSFDQLTGVFALTSDYRSYGPQIQPGF